MAKQIIVLDRIDLPSDNSFRAAFWLAVPAARQAFYVNSGTSAFKDASAGELTSIQTGAVVEVVERFSFTSLTTFASIKTALINRFTALQTAITNNNPYSNYGTYYDGSSWTNGGVI